MGKFWFDGCPLSHGLCRDSSPRGRAKGLQPQLASPFGRGAQCAHWAERATCPLNWNLPAPWTTTFNLSPQGDTATDQRSISHLRSKYCTAQLFHPPQGGFHCANGALLNAPQVQPSGRAARLKGSFCLPGPQNAVNLSGIFRSKQQAQSMKA